MIRLLLLLLALAVPSSASAQLVLSGGVAAPMSPENLTDIYRSGYSFALGFVMENGAMPYLRVRPFGSFQRFRTDPGPFQAQFENIDDVEGGEMPVLYAGADFQLRRPFGTIKPYGGPSLGYAVFSIDDIRAGGITFNLREEVSGFAVGLGGGVGFELSRNYTVFAEGHFVHVFLQGNDRSFVPVRVGVELGFDY